MKKSLVILTQAENLAASNLLGEVLGIGGNNFTVPLSMDGETVSHYGLLHQASLPDFRETLSEAQAGNLPPLDWSQYGTSEAEIQATVDALIIDVAETPYPHPRDHFLAVLADNGLSQVAGA